MSDLYKATITTIEPNQHCFRLFIEAINNEYQEVPTDEIFYMNLIADFFCGLQLGSPEGGYLDAGEAEGPCSGEPWLWVYAMKFTHDKDRIRQAHERLDGPFKDLDHYVLKDGWEDTLPSIDTWHHEGHSTWEKWRSEVIGAAAEWSRIKICETSRSEYDCAQGTVQVTLNVRDAKLLEHLVVGAKLSVFYAEDGLIYNQALAG